MVVWKITLSNPLSCKRQEGKRNQGMVEGSGGWGTPKIQRRGHSYVSRMPSVMSVTMT